LHSLNHIGTYVTTNRCQNSDLFFALRGGGGNTFGVNIEVTYRAHPKVTVQVAYVAFAATNLTTVSQFFSLLTQNANKWGEEGWGGYISLGQGSRTLFGLIMFNTNLSQADATTSMAQVRSFANSSASAETLVNNIYTIPSFYQAYQAFILPNEEKVGIATAVSSRLIPKSLLATKVRSLFAPLIQNIANIS
jgi:hypothetical protein